MSCPAFTIIFWGQCEAYLHKDQNGLERQPVSEEELTKWNLLYHFVGMQRGFVKRMTFEKCVLHFRMYFVTSKRKWKIHFCFFFLVRKNNSCCNRTGFHFMIKYTLSMANGRNDLWPSYRSELGYLVIYEALWIYQNIHLLVKNIAHAFTSKESTFLLLLKVRSGKATKYLPDVNSFDSDVNL